MPNKTIYVSEGDQELFARAQQLAGGNLSSAISKALARWVDVQEGATGGYSEIVVKVGVGNKRKVRFTAVLIGQLMDTTPSRVAQWRVYQGRTGKYVVHVERSPEFTMLGADGKPAGWKGHLGLGNVTYTETPAASTLEVVESLEELEGKVPPELYEMVARSARQPSVEELDI